MSFEANTVQPLVKSEAPTGAVSISNTFWGYIIRKGGRAENRASSGEILAMIASVTFGFIAYSQWLLPGKINEVEVLPFKIAGTIVFFVFAFLNYSIARKGLMYETQVDEKRQVVRMARRNRDGVSTLLGSYKFTDIERIYTARSRSNFVPDRLYIKPKSNERAILIATGPASELEPLRERMIEAMRPGVSKKSQRFAVTPKRVAAKPVPIRGAFAAE